MLKSSKRYLPVVLISETSEEVSSCWIKSEISGDDLAIIPDSISTDFDHFSSKKFITLVSSERSLFISLEKSDSADSALQEIIPGASLEDYFVQKSSFESFTSFEFLHRDDLKEVLASVPNLKHQTIILESVALSTSLQVVTSRLIGVKYEISSEGLLSQTDIKGIKYDLEGERLNSEELLAFGAVLAVETDSFEQWNELDELKDNQNELKQSHILKLTGIAAVSIMLVLSVGNFILFTNFSEQLNEINETLYSSNVSLSKLEELKNQASVQEELRSSLNVISSKQGAHLLDLICSEIPDQISLTNYVLEGPEKIKNKKKIKFNDRYIVIQGNTISTIALNRWMQKIESLGQITSVKLISYEDSRDKKGDFEIGIDLSNV